MTETAGYAVLQVIPSVRGVGAGMEQQLNQQMSGVGQRVGRQVGAQMGTATVGELVSKMTAGSRRMSATFVGSTNVMTRSIGNFTAGFRSADAAASAFTGRMGSMGGTTARAVRPGVQAVGGFVAGFGDAQAAASAFTGRAGSVGGLVRRGLQPGITAGQNLAAGFTDSQAAASAFTGRMGSLGGMLRPALQPGISAVSAIGTGLSTVGAGAVSAMGRIGSGAGAAFSTVTSAGSSAFSAVASAGSGAAGQITGFFSSAASTAAGAVRTVLGGAIGQVTAMLGVIGLGSLGAEVASVASGASVTQAQIEALYGAAGGGAAEVTAVMDGMADRFSGLDMSAMHEGAVSLAYMGLQGNEAVGVLERLEKATTTTGSGSVGLSRAMSALTKGVNAGKFQMDSLNQISDAGIPIYDALSDVLGVSIPEAQEMASDGAIGLTEVLDALSGDYGTWFPALLEGADNVGTTFSGAWSTIKNSIVNGFANELTPVLDRAAPMMLGLADTVSDGFDALPGVLSATKDAFVGLAQDTGLDQLPALFTGSIVPAVRDLWTTVQPLAMIIGTALVVGVRAVIEGLTRLGPVLTSVTGWLAANRRIVTLVGVAILGGVAAYYALGAASAVIRTITGVTRIWAVAQGVLNAVMAMNPITLVVVAIGALVAAAIYAYKNFDGFRNAVDATWQAIKTAAVWIWDKGLKPAFQGIAAGALWVKDAAVSLWTGGIKPAFDGIVSAAKAVGDWFSWLWTDILSPVVGWISTGVRILAGIILFILVAPVVIAVKAMGAIFSWLWENVLSPVFGWIGSAAQVVGGWFTWLWVNAIKPAVDGIAAGALWLWRNALLPAWNGIVAGAKFVGAGFSWLWGQIKTVFDWIAGHVSRWWARTRALFVLVIGFVKTGLGAAFTWFRDKIIRPVWDFISRHITNIWNNGIRPAFDKVKEGVKAMQDAFGRGKTAISKAWNGIRDSAKKPINFLIGTVYNKGIMPLWNKVAGIVGAPELKEVSKFRDGGRTRGGIPGVDSIPALVMADEYVVKRSSARKVGFGNLDYINRTGELPRFANGGRVGFPNAPNIPSASSMLDAVTDFLSPSGIFGAVGDIISGDYEGAIDRVLKPAKTITGQIGKEGLPGVPYMVVDKGGEKLKTKISELVESWNSSMEAGGGSASWVGLASASARLQRAAAFADSHHGKAYQWGGVGNPSFDCSGFTGSIERVIRGVNPRARQYTTHSFAGTPPPGWVKGLRSPYMVGVSHGGRGGGHTAGTLLGKNVESGGRGVVTGPRARGARSFPHVFGFRPVVGETDRSATGGGGNNTLYDRGGWLDTGITRVENRSGHPEPVLTHNQWDRLERLIDAVERGRGGSGVALTVNAPGRENAVDDVADGVMRGLRKASLNGLYSRAGG